MAAAVSDLRDIFPGDSEMAREMRGRDWAATPLGDPRNWREGLKIPLRMLLTSRFEMWLGWGPELNFFYNDAYIPTLGIKHPVMLGRPLQEVWSEVYADVADQVARVRNGEATWNKALLLLLERSGFPEETYHSFSYSPLQDADGSVGGLLCIVTEETERVISERHLDTLRRLGLALAGKTDEAAVIQAVQSVLGLDRRDFPFALMQLADGKGAISFHPDSDGLRSLEWDHPADGRVFPLNAKTDWPAGPWAIAPRDAMIVPIPGAPDQPAMGSLILGLNPYRMGDGKIGDFATLLATQIGGALANTATLDRERQRADRVWSHARDLMVVVGTDGIFQSVSPAWTRILGHDVADVIGRHFDDFVLPDDSSSTAQALDEAIHEGDLTGYENRFRTADGGCRWISWHTSMEDGLAYGYGRDITEQKRGLEQLALAEDALRQSQKMEAIGQLTGGVAHDFNNILMAVHSGLELIRKRIESDPQVERLIANGLKATERGAALTQRMLAFARQQELQTEDVDLRQLVLGLMDLLQSSLGPAFDIRTRFPPGLPCVHADTNQLEMALLNLVVNARDAMPEGGTIDICADLRELAAGDVPDLGAGPFVQLTVADRGRGMDHATLARAADPFFTTKGVGKGTGLGLSMVHGFARQLGGALQLESTLGRGTLAHIWLAPDKAQSPALVPADSEAELPVGSRQVVLAVDDDVIILMNTAALLEDLGHEVLEASSGAEALQIMQARPDVSLLVTDQAMPGMTGSQLIQHLRADRPDLPVILATGYGETPVGDGPLVHRLGKPFNQAELQRAIEASTRAAVAG
ncbi:PAS domain-containing protein [Croceibacterium xixiisoli]|nr:PAS domain-containing protein [Croceibacterium xixiisoli]